MKSFYRLLCLILWFPLAVSAQPDVNTTAVAESRMVEFTVSTTELAGLGLFDPVFDKMYVRGSFNGWEMISMNQISPGVFRASVSIDGPQGDTLLFKFYYERPDGKPRFNDGWEIVDERELTEGIFVNRQLVLGLADVPIVLNTVPFGVIEFHHAPMNVHLAQLNYYEVLNTPADIANHPLMGVEVRFTAIISGMALNSGFAGLNAALGVPARLHLFVVDTAATGYGRDGMGMQIVEEIVDPDMYSTLIGAHRGHIYTFTGRLTIFNGLQVQFDLTEIPVYVGNAFADMDYMHHQDLMEPMRSGTFLLNERLADGTHIINMQTYSIFAHQYVIMDGRFHRFSNPDAPRPVWAVSGDGDMIGLSDMSSRFRNDREGQYPPHMNYRRMQVDQPFTPPHEVNGTVRGYVSYVSKREPNGTSGPNPTTVVNPWYDGKIWLDGNRFEFGWIPNDLVVQQDTVIVPISRAVEFTVDVRNLIDAGFFDPNLDHLYVTGNFNGWEIASTFAAMQRISFSEFTRSMIIEGAMGDTIQYKFYYQRQSNLPTYNGGWELLSGTDPFLNRIAVLGPADVRQNLGVVPFGFLPIAPPPPVTFPVTLEEPDINWPAIVVDFDGGQLTRVVNPHKSGLNTSDHVLKMVKNVGMPWAGAYFPMAQNIDLTQVKTFHMNVWSPRAGARLLLKIENETDPTIWFEQERLIPVANEWTELLFDFSQADASQSYKKVVLIFDLGISGDGSPNFTFYVDDIRQGDVIQPPSDLIPVYLYTTTRFAPGDGDGNWLYIGLGSEDIPAVNLIGMGFALQIDTNVAVPTAYTTLGMFDDGADEDYLEMMNLSDYQFSASIVRTSGTNKLPYGPVMGIRFLVKDDVSDLYLHIHNIEIRDAAGELVEFDLITSWIHVPTRSTGIWPGDTNADGVVDVFDVEPIGFYFGVNGPGRDTRSIQWQLMESSIWPVADAVHADANGDGTVNQNDLLAVGFNYGKSIPNMVAKSLVSTLSHSNPEAFAIPLPSMRAGDVLSIPLLANSVDVRSIALRVLADMDLVSVLSATPADWFTDPAMLKLVKNEPALNRYSAAYVRTSDMATVSGDGAIITLVVQAKADLMMGDANLRIDRAQMGRGTERALPVRLLVEDGTITSMDERDVLRPSETRLEANYPNPFNPYTMIRYQLSDAAKTRLSVYDVLGREVVVLVDADLSAGSYDTMFDASGLSSGIYLIRLSVGAETFTRSMTLLK